MVKGRVKADPVFLVPVRAGHFLKIRLPGLSSGLFLGAQGLRVIGPEICPGVLPRD